MSLDTYIKTMFSGPGSHSPLNNWLWVPDKNTHDMWDAPVTKVRTRVSQSSPKPSVWWETVQETER